MNKKPGRPKTLKPEELTLTSYREYITEFKQGLHDALEDEEYEGDKETISKFLSLPTSDLNIFIVYLKLCKTTSITKIAEMLGCERIDILRIVMRTKKELKKK